MQSPKAQGFVSRALRPPATPSYRVEQVEHTPNSRICLSCPSWIRLSCRVVKQPQSRVHKARSVSTIPKPEPGARRPPLEWRQRLLSSLLVTAFLAVHYVYTPLHLLHEDHHDAHVDHSDRDFHSHHSHGHDDGAQPSSHHPHSASDHKLTIAIIRSSFVPVLDHALLSPGFLTSLVNPAPRALPRLVLLNEPRAPPRLLSPRQPRAPPAA